MIPVVGKEFRGKPVYTCQSCGLTLGLEDPNTKIICRVEAAKSDVTQLLTKKIYNSAREINEAELDPDNELDLRPGMDHRERVKMVYKKRLMDRAHLENKIAPNKDNTAAKEVIDKQAEKMADDYIYGKQNDKEIVDPRIAQKEDMCTQEEINSRLAICDTCEYYENNSCLQCGCAISRNAVYSNKLAMKSKSCPIGKWKAIHTPKKTSAGKDSSGVDSSGSGGG